MIAAAATKNPAAEHDLLEIAEQGLVPLRDACVKGPRRGRRPQAAGETTSPAAAVLDVDRRRRDGRRTVPAHTRSRRSRSRRCSTQPSQRVFREHKAGTDHEPLAAYAADVFASVRARRSRDVDREGRDATVHIVVDHGALVRGGTADGEVCEIPGVGPVDVSWVRELLGSAFLTVVIKRGKDILTVAHLGRHVPAEVRPRYWSAGVNATSRAVTTAATSNATTPTTTPKAD